MGENKSKVFLAWNTSEKEIFRAKYHSNMVIFGLLMLFVLGLPFVLFSPVYASTYSLGMTTSGTVNVDVSVSGVGANVAEDDLVVVSTCPLGYTVSISGPADRTLYRNGDSSNNVAGQMITASSGTVANPASILGNNLGTWGYTLGDNITSASNFIGLTNTTNTLSTKNAASASGGDNIVVHYGVSVQPNQAPGLYTMAESQVGANDNVITYQITTPPSCTSYTVAFDPTSTAGGTTLSGTGTMGSQVISEGISTALNSNSFTAPEGYVFKEWNTSQDGTGTSYTDGQSVTDIAAANTSITLYAQWKPREYTITFRTNNATGIVFNGVTYTDGQTLGIPITEVVNKKYHIYGNYGTRYAFSSWTATAGTFENQNYQNTAYTVTGDATITLTGQYVNTTMQNLAYASCSTTATPVYDNRDSSVYWIQKLPDNNCWMLDNLALDLTSSTVVNTLSASNTHLDSTSLNYFKNGGGTTSDRYPRTAYGTFDSTNVFGKPRTNAEVKDVTLKPSSAVNYTDSINGAYGLGQGKNGAYYDACAASVGYYCFGNGSLMGEPTGNSDYDACPVGWRMPNSSEYSLLYTNPAINSDADVFRNTFSATLPGYIYSGTIRYRGSSGYFRSLTASSSGNMSGLQVNQTSIYASTSGSSDLGESVRCINPSYYIIKFNIAGNASGIVFNGVAYSNGQTVKIPKDEAAVNKYHIYGTYGTRYAFSSWSTTAGTFENQNYQNTAFTVTGDATITLTGQYVNTAMQNLSISNCSTTAMPVYDNRDSSVYWVQKLADGNCWMLDNLALDLTDSNIVDALSTSNTHLDADSLNYFKNGGGTASNRYPILAYDAFSSFESYSQPLTDMGSKNITLRPTTTTSYTNSIIGAYGSGQGKIGGYYNYCAASVGYYCFGDGDSSGSSYGNNAYDACPAGWRMPTSNTSGEYNALYTNPAINSDDVTYREVLSTPLSGYRQGSNAYHRGIGGEIWSSTRNLPHRMYGYYVNSTTVNPSNYLYRNEGFSIRCLLGS